MKLVSSFPLPKRNRLSPSVFVLTKRLLYVRRKRRTMLVKLPDYRLSRMRRIENSVKLLLLRMQRRLRHLLHNKQQSKLNVMQKPKQSESRMRLSRRSNSRLKTSRSLRTRLSSIVSVYKLQPRRKQGKRLT
jgi:hypothetical protein